jgi:hypothetical protein
MEQADHDEVLGQWNMVTNLFGHKLNSVLSVTRDGDALCATLQDEKDGELEVTDITLDAGTLTYRYIPPTSQTNWGKGTTSSMIALLRVKGGTMTGTLSGLSDGETSYDYALTGERTSS